MGAYSNLGDLSNGQTINGSAFSDHWIDMVAVKPRLGVGQHAPFLCIRTAAAPGDPADSLSIELQVDADSGGSPEGTWKTVMILLTLAQSSGADSEVIATDERLSTAGAWIFQGQLPYQVNERYIRLYYNNAINSGAFTIDAWLNDGPVSEFRGSQVIKSDVGLPLDEAGN